MVGFEMFRRQRPRLRALALVCTRANAESPEGVARRETVAQGAANNAGYYQSLADNIAIAPHIAGYDMTSGPWAYSTYRVSARWMWQTEK